MARARRIELRLSKSQWKRLASALSNISQGVILFSAAAFFVPEVVGLSKSFSRSTAFLYFLSGLCILIGAVILSKKEE